MIRTLASILALGVASIAVAATHVPPAEWKGSEKGQSAGNPVVVEGKPMWRFEQIWPDKSVENGSAYQLMKWSGSKWIGPTEFGGQPSVAVNRSTVLMEVRGSWGGDGNASGKKIAAITFIAPAPGKYAVAAKASADVWQGSAPAQLVILKRAAGEDAAPTTVQTFELKKGADPIDLADVKVDLAAGDSIVLAAVMNNRHNAAKVKLERLKISDESSSNESTEATDK